MIRNVHHWFTPGLQCLAPSDDSDLLVSLLGDEDPGRQKLFPHADQAEPEERPPSPQAGRVMLIFCCCCCKPTRYRIKSGVFP